jgi:hypothetical protein
LWLWFCGILGGFKICIPKRHQVFPKVKIHNVNINTMTFPEINKMKSTRELSTKKYIPYDIREIIFRINTIQYKKERRQQFEKTRILVEKKHSYALFI